MLHPPASGDIQDFNGTTHEAAVAPHPALHPAAVAAPLVCRMAGCTDPLRRAYNQTHRICPEHRKLLRIVAEDGAVWRFCLQCARLHTIDEFSGDRRSCQASLLQRRQRKRQRAQASGDDRTGSARPGKRAAARGPATTTTRSGSDSLHGSGLEDRSEISCGGVEAPRPVLHILPSAGGPALLESTPSWRSSGSWQSASPPPAMLRPAGSMPPPQQPAARQPIIVFVQLGQHAPPPPSHHQPTPQSQLQHRVQHPPAMAAVQLARTPPTIHQLPCQPLPLPPAAPGLAEQAMHLLDSADLGLPLCSDVPSDDELLSISLDLFGPPREAAPASAPQAQLGDLDLDDELWRDILAPAEF